MKMLLKIIFIFLCSSLCYSFKLNHGHFLDFFFNNPALRCNCLCGMPNREGRLLGGEYVRGHEFPWMVTIIYRGIISSTGAIINDQYVLTAASAIAGASTYDIKISIGQYDGCNPDVSSANVSIDTITLHPDFNPGNKAHDLALLRLATIAPLNRRVRPICLPTPGTNYLGQVATVVSWTEDETLGGQIESTCRPRKLGLPVLGSEECAKSVSQPEYFGPDKGCAGIIGGISQICKTDVGAPVIFRNVRGIYEIIGVFTDKNECKNNPSTALYTKINQNIKWILQNTRDACYCSKR